MQVFECFWSNSSHENQKTDKIFSIVDKFLKQK